MWQRKCNRKWYYAYCVEEKRPADRSHASLLLDVEDQSIQELEIWSLPLKEQFALALQPVNGREATFKRIGAICWRNKDDGGIDDQRATVTII